MSLFERWSPNPPWDTSGDPASERDCGRCGELIAPHHRHHWRPCRPCAVRSFVGVQTLTAMGLLSARDFMYWGAQPDCSTCGGEGYLPCEDQDLSILRKSGACAVCGAYSFVLMRSIEPIGEIEGSGRHYEGVADHDVRVVPMALVDALAEHIERSTEVTGEPA